MSDCVQPVVPVRLCVVVLAHNEEARIVACLAALAGEGADAVHVVVNGSRDRTAARARGFRGVTVHEFAAGGKSRSWNRFALEMAPPGVGTFVFVDGDAVVTRGSVAALRDCLAASPNANAAAGMPRNGRNAARYRRLLREEGGLFGDLYALRGAFVDRMRVCGVRLPNDLIGDDGLLASLARTDLGPERDWDAARVVACQGAGFFAEPMRWTPAGLDAQRRRMVNYSVRHFQNRIVSAIMRAEGGAGLPRRLAMLYPEWLTRFAPRRHPVWHGFDRAALRQMARAAEG